jgi:hypothetical protein
MTITKTIARNRPALLASLLAGIALLPAPALAQAANGSCPENTTSCSVSNQNVGDTSNPSSATDTVTTSSQSGTSSTSNVSELAISPIIRPVIAQNPVNTTSGTITGGNTTGGNVTGGNTTGGNTTGTVMGGDTASNSSAMGGASTGNMQTSNIDGGASTSTSGGNTLGGATSSSGASNSTVGNTSATGGPSNATIGNTNAAGGAVGNTSATTGSLTGGTNSTSNTNSTGASNSSTNIDQSNRSVTANNQRWTFIPPVVPPTPPSMLAVGNIVTETGTCGMLQRVVREPVNATYFGFFKKANVQQGFTERLAPMIDERGQQVDYRRVPLEDGSGFRLFGHQVTQYTSILGLSGARNIAVGGGGGGGGWGQAGGGSSGAMQQMVTTLQIRECEVGTIVRPAPPAPVVYVEPARIRQ